MGKLNFEGCSGLSPLTVGQAGSLWGVGRRMALDIIVSGCLPLLHGGPYGHMDEGERAPWRMVSLETAVGFLAYRGGPGTGEPWGSRRHWEQGLEGFRPWFEEHKAKGWKVVFVDGDWVFRPSEPQPVPGTMLLVSGFQVNSGDLRISLGHS